LKSSPKSQAHPKTLKSIDFKPGCTTPNEFTEQFRRFASTIKIIGSDLLTFAPFCRANS
jgi:hypothetical protein